MHGVKAVNEGARWRRRVGGKYTAYASGHGIDEHDAGSVGASNLIRRENVHFIGCIRRGRHRNGGQAAFRKYIERSLRGGREAHSRWFAGRLERDAWWCCPEQIPDATLEYQRRAGADQR